MKRYIVIMICLFVGASSFSQNFEKERQKAERKANDFIYEANELIDKEEFVSAEMEYRKAISQKEKSVAGTYNLAHSYYKKGNFNEALFRSQEAAKNATTKTERHKAYHNIGNILMQNKKCKEAVEAFKNALRNNPNDEETRYNFALAKDCAEQQDQDGGGEDEKKDDKKEDQKEKDKKKDEGDEEKDKKDEEGDKDKKKGDDQKDEDGKPKDDKNDKGNGEKDKQKQKQKPQPGKMSPQQIKNILEAMNNQEQKVQEKINAKKQKGAKVRTEKDW
ncbi:MAG: tetratricopeptide repeat protein [Winogradskyella sp.]|nr:tetratricopeptide repeat protein [Winogradskyella sp.]RNC88467.1 MAG: tetratricopeptide repeat protein [Winogradskyella sp.]